MLSFAVEKGVQIEFAPFAPAKKQTTHAAKSPSVPVNFENFPKPKKWFFSLWICVWGQMGTQLFQKKNMNTLTTHVYTIRMLSRSFIDSEYITDPGNHVLFIIHKTYKQLNGNKFDWSRLYFVYGIYLNKHLLFISHNSIFIYMLVQMLMLPIVCLKFWRSCDSLNKNGKQNFGSNRCNSVQYI